jgi:hypothetical protein
MPGYLQSVPPGLILWLTGRHSSQTIGRSLAPLQAVPGDPGVDGDGGVPSPVPAPGRVRTLRGPRT